MHFRLRLLVSLRGRRQARIEGHRRIPGGKSVLDKRRTVFPTVSEQLTRQWIVFVNVGLMAGRYKHRADPSLE